MEKEKKVSIIVPVYNGEEYLEKCITSIQSQSYKNIEIIIINDGSTDKTSQMCEKLKLEDKRVTSVHQRNSGVSVARYHGVEKASGEYIAFVDADDWLEPLFIEQLMNELQDGDVIASGLYEERNGNTTSVTNQISAGTYEQDEDKKLLFQKMLFFDLPYKFGVLPYAWNKIYKKDILLPILRDLDKEIFDGEDVAFIYLYILKCNKIILSDYCGYHYFIRNESVSHRQREVSYLNESRIYLWMSSQLIGGEHYNIMIEQLNRYMLHMVWKRDSVMYLEANDFAFPYDKIPIGSNIILYGAGEVGKTFYCEIMKSKYCKILSWVDKNIRYHKQLDVSLDGIHILSSLSFDYILVAIKNYSLSMEVERELISLGINKQKIVLYEME